MSLTKEKIRLLEKATTLQKVKRIAFEIYENNFAEKEVILAGIDGQGYVLATLLAKELKEVSDLKVSLARVSFNKKADSQPDLDIESDVDTFKNKTVVIIDDVLNTGRTLAFSLRPFLSIPLKKLQVAVLVDRNYPMYPIAADYVGYSLSTTMNDHVQVVLGEEEEVGVYLY